MAYSQLRGSTPSTSASLRSSELEEAARALTRRIQRPEPIAHIYPADDPKLEQVLSKLRVSLRKRTATAAGGDGGVRGLARHFRIVDRNGNGALDPSEFFKVCALNRLPLSDDDVRLLFAHFDSDRSGEVAYDEFLRAVRGRLSPMRRRLAMRAFELLDRRHPDGPRGFLTVDNLKEAYSTSEHPAVRAGHLTREEALEDFLRGFEGPHGDRDGRVTRDEWERYYEEVSMAFDSDDAFGAMLQSAWRKLTVKAADGSTAPALTFVPQAEVARLEERLRVAIYTKGAGGANAAMGSKSAARSAYLNPRRLVEAAFKAVDVDGSGVISFDEFMGALRRFGLQLEEPEAAAKRATKGGAAAAAGTLRDPANRAALPAPGGVRREVVQALFSKYDADDSGGISYKEFAAALYDGDLEREAPPPKEYFPPPPQERAHRPGKPCPPENEWMKGGTGVAHALTGGRGWAA